MARPFKSSEWRSTPLRTQGFPIDVRGVELGEVLSAEANGFKSPWWAHVWPAGIAMAERILAGPPITGSCLDLGAGSGIVGVALGLRGATVTFADESPDALQLSRENAERSGLHDFDTLQLEWSKPPPGRRFPKIYAADVLYDREHFDTLMMAFRALLEPDGVAYVADPRRQPLGRLAGAAMDAGFKYFAEEDSESLLLARFTFA